MLPANLKSHFTARKIAFYVLFWGFHWFLFGFGWYKQASDERLAPLNTLGLSVWLSRGAGLVLSVDGLLLLLPMCRTILRYIRPKLRFLPLDESIYFHRQVAYAMLLFTIIHVSAHYVNFFNVEKVQLRPTTAVAVHYTAPGGVTGHIMLLCMLLMYTTAHAKIRQQSFETFWYTHHLFIPFFLGLYTHAVGCFVRDTVESYGPFDGKDFWDHCIGYQGWRWSLFGGGLYLFERLYREIRARRETEIMQVVSHPCKVMEIQFSKPSMKYKAGQWLFIQVPAVSGFQWHPFTITSCPFDPYISVHIRQVGDFTSALGDALGCGPAQAKALPNQGDSGTYTIAPPKGQKMPSLRIDGPYGAPAEDVFDNEIAVLIGMGIGVTPWASILKNIWHLRSSPNPPNRLRRVVFVWVCKEIAAFEWFQSLFDSNERQGALDPAFLSIQIYLTAQIDSDTAHNIQLHSNAGGVDPLTGLQTHTRFGRPDWARTFEDIGGEALNLTGLEASFRRNIGVYFCGPAVAGRDIKKAAKEASKDYVSFKFWKEHF